MTDSETFGELLRLHRKAAGLTQEQLAERSSLSGRAISDLERGVNRTPRKDTVQLLAAALRLSAEERSLFEATARRPTGSPSGLEQPDAAQTATLPTGRPHPGIPSPPTNLPRQPTPFIGREREVAEVAGTLRREDVCLLTLTGPGGTGKTRLALQAASALLSDFRHGVFFVSLAPVGDPDLVVSAVARTLDVTEVADEPISETLAERLRENHMLLVLDNFEHLTAAAPLVADLLAACPDLKVLVTSRAPLHLRGEREISVAPLELPDPTHLPPVEVVAQYAAVALFVARVRAIKPDFQLTEANARAVAEICARLDGLPLAIELAAPRIKVLPPHALLARLGTAEPHPQTSGGGGWSLQMLVGGAKDLPARQTTLRDTLDWSYELLDANQQVLFRRLAVFRGGCTMEAAEAICSPLGDREVDVLEGLAGLIDQSLLRAEEQPSGEMRFGMLETIREYALELLAASDEAAILQRQHATYYLALAERAEPALTGPEPRAWLDQLEVEHDNLRAALSWSRSQEGDGELGLRLAAALYRFWEVRGLSREGQKWLEELLAADESGTGAPAAVHAKALHAAGLFAYRQGDYDRAAVRWEESVAIKRELGDKLGVAASLHNLGNVAVSQGDYGRATASYEDALAIDRELGNTADIPFDLHSLGLVARDRGDYGRAADLFEESLAMQRNLGNQFGIAVSLADLGDVARELRDYGRAVDLLEESLAMQRGLGNQLGIADALRGLGDLAQEQGDYGRATALYGEGLAILQEVGDKFYIAACLESLAMLAGLEGQQERVVWLTAVAETVRAAIGAPLPPHKRAARDRLVAAARAQLGDGAFAQAWAMGRALPLERAISESIGPAG